MMRTFLVVSALVLMLFASAYPAEGALASSNPGTTYVARGPILIQGDADFTAANGVTGGNGTPEDPYRIEGWEINGLETGPGAHNDIDVRNTRAALLIRIVYLRSPWGGGEGIHLVNVSNVQMDRVVASRNRDGIHAIQSYNLTITDSNLSDSRSFSPFSWGAGISLSESDRVTVEGNRFWGNHVGIVLEASTNVTFRTNALTSEGVTIWGDLRDHFLTHEFAPDNLVNGKPLLVYQDRSGLSLDGLEAGQLLLLNCTGVQVQNFTIGGTDIAMEFAFVRDVQASGNRLYGDTLDGIYVAYSEDVRILRNSVRNHSLALELNHVADVSIADNVLSEYYYGISGSAGTNVTIRGNDAWVSTLWSGTLANLWGFDHSSLVGNRATSGYTGIDLGNSSNVTIMANVLSGKANTGISLDASRDNLVAYNYLAHPGAIGAGSSATRGNTVHHNSIIGPPLVIENSAGPNAWDDGYPSGGNYWSAYTGVDRCHGPLQDNCTAPDGIGDTPIPLAPNNTDRYPLMAPWDTPANASFSVAPTSGTTNTVFAADASTSSDDKDPASSLEIRWDWEADGLWDTAWSTTKVAQHRYAIPGDYSVRMAVRDSAGFLNITNTTVRVASPIDVSIAATPTTGPAPLTVSFQATVSGATEPITYLWRFGDGNESSAVAPAHVYDQPGSFTAALMVTDSLGYERTAFMAIDVTVGIFRVFITASPLTGVASLTVSFSSSISGGLRPFSYGWAFGDGATDSVANPTHAYQTPGVFKATFVARDVRGVLASASLLINVIAPLEATIVANTTNATSALTVAFIPEVSGGTGPYAYHWDFGDHTESTDPLPTHVYAAAGTYTVVVTITDAAGQTVTKTFVVTVRAATSPPPQSTVLTVVLYAAALALGVFGAALFLKDRRMRRRR